MTLPNFLILGAQKAGTSRLAKTLGSHPDVFMPDHEIHFFDWPANRAKGIDWYAEHFAAAGGRKAIGEKTPDYFWVTSREVNGHLPDTHRAIKDVLPDAKLIVVLRNPVERAISSMKHHIRVGRVSPRYDIDNLLVGRHRAVADGLGVIDAGRYLRFIDAYAGVFDPSRLLVLIYEEDVVRNPRPALERVCRFLDVDPDYPFENPEERVGAYHASTLGLYLRYYVPRLRRSALSWKVDAHLPTRTLRPSDATVSALYDLYAADNARLFDYLGRVPEGWAAASLSRAERGGS